MNAKNEFINHIGSRKVTCSEITFGDSYSDNVNNFNLTLGWTDEDWAAFMIYLDFEYDDGYGGQNLFGTIWYTDGTWSDRREYDGSEWYEHHACPPIPTGLNRLDKVRDQKLSKIL